MYKNIKKKTSHFIMRPLLYFLLSNQFHYQEIYKRDAPESTNLQMTITLFLFFTLPFLFNLIMILDSIVLLIGHSIFIDSIMKGNNILFISLWIIPLYIYIYNMGGYNKIFRFAKLYAIINKIKPQYPVRYIRIIILVFLTNIIIWALVLSYLKTSIR